MTKPKKWPLTTAIVVYWLILSISILAFAVLFLGVGMTPGNYQIQKGEALTFLLFPMALLGCKVLIYILRHEPGGVKLLTLASVIPLIQMLIVFVLI